MIYDISSRALLDVLDKEVGIEDSSLVFQHNPGAKLLCCRPVNKGGLMVDLMQIDPPLYI